MINPVNISEQPAGAGRPVGEQTAAYVRDPGGRLLAERRPGGSYAVVPDALGSTRFLI